MCVTIFQDVLNPCVEGIAWHESWTSLIRLPLHPDTKSVNSLISLFHVPQKQQRFYIPFNWFVPVADHHSDCSDFCLAICVQIREYTLKGASCCLLHLGLCKQLKLLFWCVVGNCQTIVDVMMMLAVLMSGSVIIQQNWRSLGRFYSSL